MKILGKTSDGLKRCYNVLVEASEIEKERDRRLGEVAKSVKLDGFRPGKVPLQMVQKMYGDSLTSEAKKSAIDAAAKKVLADEKLLISFNYETNPVKDDENGIEFEMKFELIPSFELKDYTGIRLTKYMADATDAEVSERLDGMLKSHKSWILDEKAKKVSKGQKISIDLTLLSKLKKHKDDKSEGLEIIVGDETLIDNFWEHLVGAKLNDTVEFDINYPENFQDKNLAGKKVHYSALVKKIFKEAEAKLDDEFAKTMGFETLEKAKEWVKSRLIADYEHTSRSILKRDLLDAMSSMYDFDVPSKMFELEKNEVVRQIKSEAERLKKEFTPEIEKECEKIATTRVRLGFVVAEIAKREKVVVSQKEIASAVRNIAMMYPGHEKAVAEMYYKRPGAINTVVGPILEDKVVGFVLDKLDLVEKHCSAKELIAIDEEPFEFFVDKNDQKKSSAKAQERVPAKEKTTKKSAEAAADKNSKKKTKAESSVE